MYIYMPHIMFRLHVATVGESLIHVHSRFIILRSVTMKPKPARACTYVYTVSHTLHEHALNTEEQCSSTANNES